MKFAATILTSLLLLGVCSARTLDTSSPREMDDKMKSKDVVSWTVDQENRREGAQSKAEEQSTQQWGQFRETLYKKLKNMYQQATSSGKTYQVDSIPRLSDPLYIGDATGEKGELSIKYQNVQFLGLNTAEHAVINVDASSHEATLTVSMDSIEISGSYAVIDPTTNLVGQFNVKISGDVSFVSTYRYQQNGNNVGLLSTDGKLNYVSYSGQYDKAMLPESMKKVLEVTLMEKVNEQVHAELHAKMSEQVYQYIREVSLGNQQNPVDRFMREGIQNAIHGIQHVLSKRGVFSIDLTSADNELVYNKFHAKIESVKLNGLEKLRLFSHQVAKENSDKVHASLRLAIDKPTATAIVNLQETHDKNAPFQKVKIDFDIEQLMADLWLEKSTRQSGLELRSFQAKIDRIRPLDIEKFEGEVKNLIKERLAERMKGYVEDGLNRFIRDEYMAITTQGVLPPSQENRFTLKSDESRMNL